MNAMGTPFFSVVWFNTTEFIALESYAVEIRVYELIVSPVYRVQMKSGMLVSYIASSHN